MNRRVFTPLIATSLLSLVACVSRVEPTAARRPGDSAALDALRHRAERLWVARRDLDCPTIFTLENPKGKEAISETEILERCRKDEHLRIVDFDLRSAEVNGELGWIRSVYHVRFQKAADAESADSWEKWYKVNGEWFPVDPSETTHYPEPPSLRSAPAEADLKERFLLSWEARRRGDWHQLYELSDPLDHDAVDEATFIGSESLFQYLGFTLVWVEVIGERGRVRVAYEHKVTDPSLTKLPPRTLTITEKWVARDGKWYRDLKRP